MHNWLLNLCILRTNRKRGGGEGSRGEETTPLLHATFPFLLPSFTPQRYSPEEARKVAKELLQTNRSSLALCCAYAQLEEVSGNIIPARKVFTSSSLFLSPHISSVALHSFFDILLILLNRCMRRRSRIMRSYNRCSSRRVFNCSALTLKWKWL